MDAATRIYFKNCILANFEFYNFSKYLGPQPLQKDWLTLDLPKILHETVTLSKVLRKNVVITIFKKCILLDFTFNWLEFWFLDLKRGLRNFKCT